MLGEGLPWRNGGGARRFAAAAELDGPAAALRAWGVFWRLGIAASVAAGLR